MSIRYRVSIAALILGVLVQAQDRNYLERTVTISGQLRERWEATDGANFAITPAASYMMSRIRLGVAYKPTSWLRFYGEAQDARVLFYKAKPSNAVDDPFDLRQGYVEIGTLEGPGVKARVGRQDLFIGSNACSLPATGATSRSRTT